MILSVSCGYAPVPGNGRLGKAAWSEILPEGGSTINVAPAANRFGRPFWDIRIGKAGLLAIGDSSAAYYPSSQRLMLPANPGDRVHWQDRMLGTIVVWSRTAGLIKRNGGDEAFAVRDRTNRFRRGDAVSFTTAHDADRVEWAVNLAAA